MTAPPLARVRASWLRRMLAWWRMAWWSRRRSWPCCLGRHTPAEHVRVHNGRPPINPDHPCTSKPCALCLAFELSAGRYSDRTHASDRPVSLPVAGPGTRVSR